jgi:hypothetical protein
MYSYRCTVFKVVSLCFDKSSNPCDQWRVILMGQRHVYSYLSLYTYHSTNWPPLQLLLTVHVSQHEVTTLSAASHTTDITVTCTVVPRNSTSRNSTVSQFDSWVAPASACASIELCVVICYLSVLIEVRWCSLVLFVLIFNSAFFIPYNIKNE